MKNYTLFVFVIFISTLFSQENPWLNKSEKNPWIKDSTAVSAAAKIDSTNLVNEKINSDSIDFEALGKLETTGNGEFIIGFTSGFILNVLGFVPSSIASIIPTIKSVKKIRHLKNEYPTITKRKLNSYKKGVQTKRTKKALSGTIYGAITQLVAIMVLIKLN